MLQGQLLIVLFLVIYRTTGHLQQRARRNDPECSLSMVLRNRAYVVFAPEKVLTNALQFAFNFLNISHPLWCFAILSPMTNIDFSFFFPFGLSFLWSPAVIVFCGLQLLSNDLTIATFFLTFLDVSSSCLSFWLSFSLLQKHPEVFLFWLSLLSMVLCLVVVCN